MAITRKRPATEKSSGDAPPAPVVPDSPTIDMGQRMVNLMVVLDPIGKLIEGKLKTNKESFKVANDPGSYASSDGKGAVIIETSDTLSDDSKKQEVITELKSRGLWEQASSTDLDMKKLEGLYAENPDLKTFVEQRKTRGKRLSVKSFDKTPAEQALRQILNDAGLS